MKIIVYCDSLGGFGLPVFSVIHFSTWLAQSTHLCRAYLHSQLFFVCNRVFITNTYLMCSECSSFQCFVFSSLYAAFLTLSKVCLSTLCNFVLESLLLGLLSLCIRARGSELVKISLLPWYIKGAADPWLVSWVTPAFVLRRHLCEESLFSCCVLPNGLVRQPPGVTLVVSIVVRSLQLGWGSDGGAVLSTRSLGLLERQCVAGGDGAVVEHDAWGTT